MENLRCLKLAFASYVWLGFRINVETFVADRRRLMNRDMNRDRNEDRNRDMD
jgi:hypothetical protein